jgi:hypothetical protein
LLPVIAGAVIIAGLYALELATTVPFTNTPVVPLTTVPAASVVALAVLVAPGDMNVVIADEGILVSSGNVIPELPVIETVMTVLKQVLRFQPKKH